MRMYLIALGITLITAGTAIADTLPEVEVWKTSTCGCCEKWIGHLEREGFKVVAHDVDRVADARTALGMPQRFASCHTARIAFYAVEGHVPAADIKRLIAEHPRAIGLAVPGMPAGSPGMEGPRKVAYETLLINRDGRTTVFAQH
jgi:hypothetical protein